MKLTVKKEVSEEIEIGEFPIYRKNYPVYYAILSEKKAIRVDCSEHWEDAGISTITNKLTVLRILGDENYIPMEDFEFTEVYNDARDFINRDFEILQTA